MLVLPFLACCTSPRSTKIEVVFRWNCSLVETVASAVGPHHGICRSHALRTMHHITEENRDELSRSPRPHPTKEEIWKRYISSPLYYDEITL